MAFCEQGEIADLVSLEKADDFIAKRVGDKGWVVEFSYTPRSDFSLGKSIWKGVKTRRGRKRIFSRLNGVEKFMKLVGVKEFTVIL